MRRNSKAAKYVAPKYAIGQLVKLSMRHHTLAYGRIGIICVMWPSQNGPFSWRYTVLVDERMIPVDEEELNDGAII